jgi:hypothetical protein
MTRFTHGIKHGFPPVPKFGVEEVRSSVQHRGIGTNQCGTGYIFMSLDVGFNETWQGLNIIIKKNK